MTILMLDLSSSLLFYLGLETILLKLALSLQATNLSYLTLE